MSQDEFFRFTMVAVVLAFLGVFAFLAETERDRIPKSDARMLSETRIDNIRMREICLRGQRFVIVGDNGAVQVFEKKGRETVPAGCDAAPSQDVP